MAGKISILTLSLILMVYPGASILQFGNNGV